MPHFLSELKLAVRTWTHRPGLAVSAIFTLSLGLGSATAIWSLVHAVLLAPLPYAEPARTAAVFCAMGVYGALAAMVEKRRGEIGIRGDARNRRPGGTGLCH